MSVALRSVGGGGSASELRSDAGIFFGFGVEETLSRHLDLLTMETIIKQVAPTVGASGALIFSFPEDVYILAVEVYGKTTPANLQGAFLTVADPSSTSAMGIYLTTPSEETIFGGNFTLPLVAITALSHNANLCQPVFPMFVKAGFDFTFGATADAVGGCSMALDLLIARTPKGVPIPH